MNIIDSLKGVLPQLNAPPSVDRLEAKALGAGIPRRIHQTVRSKNALSPAIERNIREIRGLNTGWRYFLHDDSDIPGVLESHFGQDLLRRFQQINPEYGAARADLFRYCLLYAEGGVYLDIKSSTKRPLDEVLEPDDKFLLAQWGSRKTGAGWGQAQALRKVAGGEYIQWFIACAPGHPFLKAVIENVLGNIERYRPALHGVGRVGVLSVTGPIAYTLAIHPLLQKHSYRRASYEDMGIVYSIFEDDLEHRSHLTGRHYTELGSPVVRLGTRAKIQDRVFSGLKAVRRGLVDRGR